RAAGLARARDDRPDRPALGRAQADPRPARRAPHQDLPSRLDAPDLARIASAVAQPAGPPSSLASPSPQPGRLAATSDGTRHRTTADDRRPAEPGIGS